MAQDRLIWLLVVILVLVVCLTAPGRHQPQAAVTTYHTKKDLPENIEVYEVRRHILIRVQVGNGLMADPEVWDTKNYRLIRTSDAWDVVLRKVHNNPTEVVHIQTAHIFLPDDEYDKHPMVDVYFVNADGKRLGMCGHAALPGEAFVVTVQNERLGRTTQHKATEDNPADQDDTQPRLVRPKSTTTAQVIDGMTWVVATLPVYNPADYTVTQRPGICLVEYVTDLPGGGRMKGKHEIWCNCPCQLVLVDAGGSVLEHRANISTP